ncbi:MAG: S1/P1 nuclease [Verrucomicrobia bacterium]|nr:S1/P1 nuclease [Verrucomicrobiota bacterium]MBI3870889.1 S1/P1 nuclease [Verrucomicrobiota bacterium]
MKPSLITLVLVLALMSAWVQAACAFNADGHMIAAALAYRQLDPATKRAVDALLKQHPEYRVWKRSFKSGLGVDLGTYAFMRASAWPDEIRRSGDPFDHPNWHFVDYPLRPPQFPSEPRPAPTDDVLFGMNESEGIIADTSVPARTRAAHLSWLIHLTADIHQPLHCSSLFNATYPAPDGDRGGNRFFIRPAQVGIKLHSFWDGLLGSSGTPRTLLNGAIDLGSRFPATSFPQLDTHLTVESWTTESRSLAIHVAYNLGSLEGHDAASSALTVSAQYLAAAKDLGEKQVALAGYRLAKQIRALLPGGP